MRIHLPLHPHHFAQPSAGTSSSSSPPPLVQLGGDLVIVELQGSLTYEGDKSNGVLGVIGLDRPERPTLHLGEHHLLHGKFVNLQKPYAVIRRVVGNPSSSKALALEGHASEEESGTSNGSSEEDDDEEDKPLFEPNPDLDLFPSTPVNTKIRSLQDSSSPISRNPASTPKDYSSDLEQGSSPPQSSLPYTEAEDEEDEEESRKRKRLKLDKEKMKKVKAKAEAKLRYKGEKERTRHYEVVGVVRKKVVFALRPEPLVAPTLLPE
ncbi:hypothetical protein IAR55_003363 [Kwoniella newhampshirensis]|uniref:Chromosome transmission fidelity protein 8 n=1 Tax=Kwoniella newhampshirensis TaxID=1651941 RepID=A0AAW0YZD4_9TREE